MRAASRCAVSALALVLCAVTAADAAPRCVAIIGVKAYLATGPTDAVNVILDGRQIHSVGARAAVPVDCVRIDGKDKVVTAGLVDPMTALGLEEVSLEPSANDVDAVAAKAPDKPVVRAAFRAVDAYNPSSVAIPVTRLEGVTSAVTAPRGGIVEGQAAWVDLDGTTQAAAVQQPSIGVVVRLGATEGSRAARLHQLMEVLDEARAFQAVRADWERNKTRPFPFPRRELEALQPVLAGKTPLIVRIDRASEIEALLRVTEPLGIRLVVAGGAEAWRVAPELARRKVPVIVHPYVFGPGSFDQIHARRDNAKRLHAAGVPLMLSTFGVHTVSRLRQYAGNAVREGLDHAAAVKAITQTPAEVFGLAQHGRLEAGAVANVVLWSGDPLELSTRVEKVFIHGRDVPLVSRQTLLFQKYRKMPGTPAPLPIQ